MNTKEFIKKAVSIHGDRYDYSESTYHYRNPVKIICRSHGAFYQRYDHHISQKRRSGCRACYEDSLKNSQEQVISKFVSVHGDRYDYSKVKYKGARSNVLVVCRDHGEFQVTPASHASGSECMKCHIQGVTGDTESFVEKAKQIHKGKYSYEKTEYKRSSEYVVITCREHGDFQKTPDNHIHKTRPQGCPKCAEYSGFDRGAKGFVYVLTSQCGCFAKVGVSNSPRKRIERLKKQTPFRFTLSKAIAFSTGKEAEIFERRTHKTNDRAGFCGFDGCTEWLVITDKLKGSLGLA